ncbi:hypothetical protein VE26_15410 [Devosia chinhatensis]|uniref:DUF2259 domain-containing protein n=2 Tax=Devosia chinhatensis TaxID=429727 RepID=A0A0F5FGQ1_9HYPH|nr:hypothetical protein VE26_15410 [Devosia chinhatensis]
MAGALAVLLLCLGAISALAGDRALINYLGYSTDLRHFAFEEFGIQDGSGFAYANVYVIDLRTDSWVAGTPIRMRSDDQAVTLATIRAQAMTKAGAVLADLDIGVPVEIAALLGDGVPDADGKSLVFGAPAYQPGSVSGRHELSLSAFPAEAANPCMDWFAAAPLGFELTLSEDGTARRVHRDAALPAARGCPQDYRLHSVVMPFGGLALEHAVAIVSSYPGGFEGPDRRFLAVPLAP